jgi:hypothetical protein
MLSAIIFLLTMRVNRELSREVVAREPVLIEPLTSRLAPSGNELCAIGVVVRHRGALGRRC